MCFAFWRQNEQPNIVYLHLNQLLLKCFMTLLQTLTSNLSDLHLLKPTFLVLLQKSDISHIQYELLSQPAWFCQWKQNHSWTTLIIWLCFIHYPSSLHTQMHTGPPILQPVKRCETHFRASRWARTDSKSVQSSQKLYLCMPLTWPDNS